MLIFITLMILLLTNNITGFDNFIYNIVIKLKCKPITMLFKGITFLCSTEFIIIALLLIMIFAKKKKHKIFIPLNTGICCLINQVLKQIFRRPRPTGINIITETGFSFPSGHSMVSLSFYGLLAYIIYNKKDMKKSTKIIYISLLTLLIILIGVSRIYLGVHFASDVIAGFALSLAYLLVYTKYFKEKIL